MTRLRQLMVGLFLLVMVFNVKAVCPNQPAFCPSVIGVDLHEAGLEKVLEIFTEKLVEASSNKGPVHPATILNKAFFKKLDKAIVKVPTTKGVKLNGIELKALKFKNQKVDCGKDSCTIKLDIEDLKFGGEFTPVGEKTKKRVFNYSIGDKGTEPTQIALNFSLKNFNNQIEARAFIQDFQITYPQKNINLDFETIDGNIIDKAIDGVVRTAINSYVGQQIRSALFNHLFKDKIVGLANKTISNLEVIEKITKDKLSFAVPSLYVQDLYDRNILKAQAEEMNNKLDEVLNSYESKPLDEIYKRNKLLGIVPLGKSENKVFPQKEVKEFFESYRGSGHELSYGEISRVTTQLEMLKEQLFKRYEEVSKNEEEKKKYLRNIGDDFNMINELITMGDVLKEDIEKIIEERYLKISLGAHLKKLSKEGLAASLSCEEISECMTNHSPGNPNYDLSLQFNIEAINELLSLYHQKGFFDICLNPSASVEQKKFFNCASKGIKKVDFKGSS